MELFNDKQLAQIREVVIGVIEKVTPTYLSSVATKEDFRSLNARFDIFESKFKLIDDKFESIDNQFSKLTDLVV